MNTPDIINKARIKKGLSKNDLSQLIGISEMHVYDLESYEDELEMTLDIGQIYKLSMLLDLSPAILNKKLENCQITENQAFEKIRLLISKAETPIEELSEQIGWELEACAKSAKSLKEQPIDFFKDFAAWFKIPIESVLPNLKNI